LLTYHHPLSSWSPLHVPISAFWSVFVSGCSLGLCASGLADLSKSLTLCPRSLDGRKWSRQPCRTHAGAGSGVRGEAWAHSSGLGGGIECINASRRKVCCLPRSMFTSHPMVRRTGGRRQKKAKLVDTSGRAPQGYRCWCGRGCRCRAWRRAQPRAAG
ncbi:hypothetical protein B0H14DRAFT_3755353, partial [Mycena olivaceomarginata]